MADHEISIVRDQCL